MNAREASAQAVRAAVDRGELPRGGPSEAAARGIIDEVPAGYWRRWGEAAAERIRAQHRGGNR